MKWHQIFLILFLAVFIYRLSKNVFAYFRTNYYINAAFKNANLNFKEAEPGIDKILSDANLYSDDTNLDDLLYARGVFKIRIKENFSIFFWIESFIFLPIKLLNSLGINKRKSSKATDALISVLWWIFSFIVGLFSDEIKSFIVSLF